jgi:outer membrane protein assembly factor BamD (BamD/ComL family)
MSKLRSCLKKRDLLHNPQVSKEEFSKYGREYLADGRLVDALDYFEKAGDLEGIRRIHEQSIIDGDPFLLQKTSKLAGDPIAEEDWRKVGHKTLAEGRLHQALTAFKAIADEEQINKIQLMLRS